MTFEWKDEYSVKIKELDEQHKKLFSLILQLESAANSQDFNTIVKNVLEELMEYVHVHFDTEEDYLKRAHYAGLEAHHDIHEDIKKDLNDKINDLFSRKATALDVVGLRNFLIDWLKHHIIEQDQMYVGALQEFHD